MEKELEVKVLGIDIDEIEEKIVNLKGKLIADELQVNTLIDSTKNPIKNSVDAYLRIRENIELNSGIEDKETVLEILKNLGFDKIEVGHKKRRSYKLNGARIDLDIWDKQTYPFPYMEIEVKDLKHLNEITRLLEIPQENISNKSIVELQEELKLL